MTLERLKNRYYKNGAAKLNILIYFLLLFKAGFYFSEQLSRFTAPLYLILILVINGKRVLKFEKSKTILFFVYLLLIIVNFLFNGFPSVEGSLLILVNLVTAFIISNVVSEEEFCNSFRKVIFAICIASIIGFLIMFFARDLSNVFPALVNSNGRIGRYALLVILSDFASSTSGLQRVQGIFWEPGAFQCMIVFAVVFEMFKTKTFTLKRMIIYAITILLTFSTTGYVCLILLIALAVNKESKSFIVIRSALIIGALVFLYISLQDTSISFLQYTMFGKIRMILNYQEGVTSFASSRIDSIILPLKYFKTNIFLGIGERGYSEMARVAGHAMFTCTPINYVVKYGSFFGAISFWGMFRFFYKRNMSIVNGLIITLCLLITMSTEALTLNPILTCMILYGFGSNLNVEHSIEEVK